MRYPIWQVFSASKYVGNNHLTNGGPNCDLPPPGVANTFVKNRLSSAEISRYRLPAECYF